nr:unnamed protein product [Callosobruchus chinensis]
MLPVPRTENITALRSGLDVTLVLLGGTKSVPNILGLVNLRFLLRIPAYSYGQHCVL